MADGRNDFLDQDYDYFDVNMEHLSSAMLEAKKAFDEYFEKEGLDGSYWSLRLKGYVLGTDSFNPFKEIAMDFRLDADREEEDTDE